jgi:putative DNA primase/helicase
MHEELTSVQLAQMLREKNVNVIPLQPRSKIPSDSWKMYQKEKYNGPIHQGHNYACLCGEISDNLVVIDIDKTTDDKILDQIFPNALDNTLVVKTGSGGYHIYMRVMRLPNSTKLDHNGVHIDVQADGKYVVGAGSIHPNGKRYEIISNTMDIDYGDFQKIVVNLDKIGFKISETSAGLLAAGGIATGERHSAAVQYANHLLFKVGVNYDTLLYEMGRWNESNKPPTDENEIKRVCDDCYQYFQRKNNEKIKNISGKDAKDKKSDDWADEIMLEYTLKTLRDTDEMLYYKDGIYHFDPVHVIVKSECEKIIPDCSERLVNEIIKKIKRRTYVSRDDFDANDNILNLKNGLFDIEKMEIKNHTPNYLSLVQLPVNYNPDAIAHGFIKFIKECLPEPNDLYLMIEGFANCLLKNTNFEKVFMLIGEGANGKSTFLGIMESVLGATNVSSQSLHDLTFERFAMASLYGKLANMHPDIESSELKNTGLLKALISGDNVTAEKKYMPAFSFHNKAKLFFSANRFPETVDQSSAFFRRFIIIDWQVSFLNRADTKLKERISNDPEEIAGIFNILVRMIKPLLTRGNFRNTKQIEHLRKAWNEKANPIRKFIDEYLHLGHDYYLSKPLAYEEYGKFCETNHVVKESAYAFSRTLKKLANLDQGSKRIDNVPTHVYLGACLRSQLRNMNDNATERQSHL